MEVRCYTGDFFGSQVGNNYCPNCGLSYAYTGGWWGTVPPATCQCLLGNTWVTFPKITSVSCPKCSRLLADEEELHWHLKNHMQLKEMGIE